MTGLLRQIRKANLLGSHALAEPFAGGAGASLSLLLQEETSRIFINDADKAIHDFWWSILNRQKDFSRLLSKTRVCMTEWRRQRDIYRSKKRLSMLRRGFSAFYLNRCNRSGIIMNGGPIGGIDQKGEWKLDARFNKVELNARCERIAEYRDRIHVSCSDGIDFLDSIDLESTMLFIDPPYFVKGKTLYLNLLDEAYHQKLANRLANLQNVAWVLTYDDCPEIRAMYSDWALIRPFSLKYAAADRRSGREILIAPKWMRLPKTQDSAAIDW